MTVNLCLANPGKKGYGARGEWGRGRLSVYVQTPLAREDRAPTLFELMPMEDRELFLSQETMIRTPSKWTSVSPEETLPPDDAAVVMDVLAQ